MHFGNRQTDGQHHCVKALSQTEIVGQLGV